MGREGEPGVTRIARADYKPERAADGAVYHVTVGDRLFMVVVGFAKTLVFQRHKRPDIFVMCREIGHEFDPELAVTGYLLGPSKICMDPVVDLQSRLDGREKAYWRLHNENQRLRNALRVPEKRGRKKGGSRNS